MSDLLTIGYPDTETAREVLCSLDDLQVHRKALQVHDAVVLQRRPDGRVDIERWVHPAALETGASALIGGIIGSLLFAPLLGAALGAAAGATRAALADLGIPDDYMQQLGQSLPVGSAAVILLADVTSPDPVLAALSRPGSTVLRTSLNAAGDQRLRAALSTSNTYPS